MIVAAFFFRNALIILIGLLKANGVLLLSPHPFSALVESFKFIDIFSFILLPSLSINIFISFFFITNHQLLQIFTSQYWTVKHLFIIIVVNIRIVLYELVSFDIRDFILDRFAIAFQTCCMMYLKS